MPTLRKTAVEIEKMSDAVITDEAEGFHTDRIDTECDWHKAIKIDSDGNLVSSHLAIRYTGATKAREFSPVYHHHASVCVSAEMIEDETYVASDDVHEYEYTSTVELEFNIVLTMLQTQWDGDDCVMLYSVDEA